MEPYRVNLDVYNGPLDLLLYLIRRDEVDIYDIPIASVTQQYCRYVEMIQQVDPNLAGEFLVLAATLLEIKSRMLLPSAPAEEGVAEEAGLGDPRSELVRQLLQYKAFKDAAAELRVSAEQQAMRFPRPGLKPDLGEPELELENVQIWHLLEAFNKIMASIGRTSAMHEVIYDDTPAALHAADILDRLERQGNLTFRQVFEGRTRRSEVIGLFLAMLELIRQKQIQIKQETVFGEIHLFRIDQSEAGSSTSEETMIASDESFVLHADDTPDVNVLASAGAALEDRTAVAETARPSRFADLDLRDRKKQEEPEEEEQEDEEEWETEQEEEDDDEFGDEDDEELDDDELEEEGDEEEFEEEEDEEFAEDEDEELEPGEEDLDDEDELEDDEDDEEDWDDEEEEDDEDEDEDDDDEDDDLDDEDEEL